MKKKKNDNTVNIVLFLVFAAVGWFVWKKVKNKASGGLVNTTSFHESPLSIPSLSTGGIAANNVIPIGNNPLTAVAASSSASSPVLKKGNVGSEVIDLQNKLNEFGYKLDVDGNFGKLTLEAVKDFQHKTGLTVDGVVGHDTWSILNGYKMPDWQKDFLGI